MHYVEAGQGDPILFLHGIPTSCYLWRNIIPHLAPLGRCIALDLIGFGYSDKPDIEYSIKDHIKYVGKFIEALGLKKITLIMHGWGSIIGFDYAMGHEANCKGLVFYEAFLRSLNETSVSLPFQEQVMRLHDSQNINVTNNGIAFVDTLISQAVMRQLTEEEMQNYRQPFAEQGSNKPILQYLHELPTGEVRGAVDKIIVAYSNKLMHSALPKLLLYSVPGFITTIATVMWAKEHLSDLEIVDVGEELHLAQESSPQLMGETMSVWLQGVEQR
jgi:haloalkane dehalogenase